jgi:hypothetical protein
MSVIFLDNDYIILDFKAFIAGELVEYIVHDKYTQRELSKT